MFTGFDRIVEERILRAQREGQFDDLEGTGQPLHLEDNTNIPEDLRLAHKILRNADCLPPEIELKREIRKTEDLLSAVEDATEKYWVIKKLNFLIMKLNSLRNGNVQMDMDQHYAAKVAERIEHGRETSTGRT